MAGWVRSAAFLLALATLTVAGELPILAVVWAARHVEPFLPGWPTPAIAAAEWVIAVAAVAVGGYWLLGRPTIAAFRRKPRGPARHSKSDPHASAGERLLRAGRGGWGVAFVLASILGGSALVGWWFARLGDPALYRRTWAAAWILAVVACTYQFLWFGPYRVVGLAAFGGILAVGMLSPYLPTRRVVR